MNNGHSNRDGKRVSFKESSKDNQIKGVLKQQKDLKSNDKSETIVNNNFKYNKDVVEMQINNPNFTNRKSFEQTFNPKKEGKNGEEHNSNNGSN